MYGKIFASTYTGSMYGAGPTVFAVWGYVIANAGFGVVELNPKAIASALGSPEADVVAAIDVLCSPDENSRSKDEQGRRLIREGQFQHRVVNHSFYRSILNETERREYNRLAQQRHRQSKTVSMTVNEKSALSAQTETETDSRSIDQKEKREREVAKAPRAPKKPRAESWRRVPEAFQPDDRHREIAASLRLSIAVELENFKDYEFKTPKTDAAAAFRTWLRRSSNFVGSGSQKSSGPKQPNGGAWRPRIEEA